MDVAPCGALSDRLRGPPGKDGPTDSQSAGNSERYFEPDLIDDDTTRDRGEERPR